MMGPYHRGRFLAKQFIRRNTDYLKRTSSGSDLVIYCDRTAHQWSPAAKGFAGAEEAVICLTTELVKLGWDVTVYNNCGDKPVVDEAVTYRPWWEFNPLDKQDVLILWRSPRFLDWRINADRIFLDVHDTIPSTAFTEGNRIEKIEKVFFKSQFHRTLHSSLPEEKVIVIPNGIDFSLLRNHKTKDPYLLINTSSADRCMNVLPKLFKEVKRRVPQARLQWSYGWGLFELYNANDAEKMQWMKQTQREMDDAGIESLGYLTYAELGKLYQRGAIFAYPSDFLENDCISVKKAQACGCVPVTTDAGALATSVQFGVKIPCKPTTTASRPRFHFGIEDPESQRLWVDATVDLLTNPAKRAQIADQGGNWAHQFAAPQIAVRWDEVLRGRIPIS